MRIFPVLAALFVFLSCSDAPTVPVGARTGVAHFAPERVGAVLQFEPRLDVREVLWGPALAGDSSFYASEVKRGRVLLYADDGLGTAIRFRVVADNATPAHIEGRIISTARADGSHDSGQGSSIVFNRP